MQTYIGAHPGSRSAPPPAKNNKENPRVRIKKQEAKLHWPARINPTEHEIRGFNSRTSQPCKSEIAARYAYQFFEMADFAVHDWPARQTKEICQDPEEKRCELFAADRSIGEEEVKGTEPSIAGSEASGFFRRDERGWSRERRWSCLERKSSLFSLNFCCLALEECFFQIFFCAYFFLLILLIKKT